MSWYSTGTATFTNSSNTVMGSGTNWMPPNVQVGDAIHAPDGAVYEITAVVSADEITIAPAYQATTVAGAAYRIQPTRGVLSDLLGQIATLLTNYQGGVDGILSGRFPDGNAATPALRFLGDEDTGLYRKAPNTIGVAAGGNEVAEIGTGGVAINGTLSGSSVQSNPTDLTPDKVLQTGAFGLGGTDLNAVRLNDGESDLGSGFYSGSGGTADVETFPSSNSRYNPFINVTRRINGSDYGQVRLFFSDEAMFICTRASLASNWETTHQVISRENMLGTVGQSSGVPTGAVIERGSNANGEYVRFADGTQICTNGNAAITTTPAAFTGTIVKIDGDKLWLGNWF